MTLSTRISQYTEAALDYQQAKTAANQSEAGALYRDAKKLLKSWYWFYFERESIIHLVHPALREKVAKKLAKWEAKGCPYLIGDVCVRQAGLMQKVCKIYEAIYQITLKAPELIHLRQSKKAFKTKSFEYFLDGVTPAQLKLHIGKALNDNTLKKVEGWYNNFQKQQGGLGVCAIL